METCFCRGKGTLTGETAAPVLLWVNSNQFFQITILPVVTQQQIEAFTVQKYFFNIYFLFLFYLIASHAMAVEDAHFLIFLAAHVV